MVASPEICRRNGSLSRGPKTERGKAIASRNALKHGLLSSQPPLLATEDLTTFDGLMESLASHYQPVGPVEHFLIQQVAMGMVKQHRLWATESAIANLEILQARKKAEFPDFVEPSEDWATGLALLEEMGGKRMSLGELLVKESKTLKGLVECLTLDIKRAKVATPKEVLPDFQESIGHNYFHQIRKHPVYVEQDEFDAWLEPTCQKKRLTPADVELAVSWASRIVELAQQRQSEIVAKLDGMVEVEQAIAQARTQAKSIQTGELATLFTRYQTANDKSLYAAIDRLEQMTQQRQNKGSMGSFGKIAPSAQAQADG